jgi:hypothetical protein
MCTLGYTVCCLTEKKRERERDLMCQSSFLCWKNYAFRQALPEAPQLSKLFKKTVTFTQT